MMYYLCAEYYQGSGRLSRTWIVESGESPDTPDGDGAVAYPFNDMGGRVVAAYISEVEARSAEDVLWDEEA
jgi:hypothetical protein